MTPLTENELSAIIVDTAFKIHKELGPGLLESVYEAILYYELTQLGLDVQRQKGVAVIWFDIHMDIGFRADLIVENKVIVENIPLVFKKILLTYLRLTNIRLGLLINFNVELIKDGINRVVNRL